jgi:hypothetical protein
MKSSIDSPDPEVSEKKRNKKMPIGSDILIDNPQQKFSNVKYLSTPKLINEGSIIFVSFITYTIVHLYCRYLAKYYCSPLPSDLNTIDFMIHGPIPGAVLFTAF